jgi:hypothetical protein
LGRQRIVTAGLTRTVDRRVGDSVVIRAGARAGTRGTIVWSGIDGSCGCRSIVVRLEGGGEWWGKPYEVS